MLPRTSIPQQWAMIGRQPVATRCWKHSDEICQDQRSVVAWPFLRIARTKKRAVVMIAGAKSWRGPEWWGMRDSGDGCCVRKRRRVRGYRGCSYRCRRVEGVVWMLRSFWFRHTRGEKASGQYEEEWRDDKGDGRLLSDAALNRKILHVKLCS